MHYHLCDNFHNGSRILNEDAQISTLRTALRTLKILCNNKPTQPDSKDVSQCIDDMVKLMSHEDPEVKENALLAFSYLSDACLKQVKKVADQMMCTRLVRFLHHEKDVIVVAALQSLSNIMSGKMNKDIDDYIQFVVDSNPFPHFCRLITISNEVIRAETCLAICKITAGTSDHVQKVIDADLFPILLDIIGSSSNGQDARKWAARAFYKATCRGTNEQVEKLHDMGAMGPLSTLLAEAHEKKFTDALQSVVKGYHNLLVKGGDRVQEYSNEIIQGYREYL